jgi:hypothetical protein
LKLDITDFEDSINDINLALDSKVNQVDFDNVVSDLTDEINLKAPQITTYTKIEVDNLLDNLDLGLTYDDVNNENELLNIPVNNLQNISNEKIEWNGDIIEETRVFQNSDKTGVSFGVDFDEDFRVWLI